MRYKIYTMKHLYILAAMLFYGLTSNAQTSIDPGTNTGDTGSVTFTYQGSSVQLTTVRAADGNIWLQQNLGSAQVATSLTDADSYGDLFQWGRWDDGHQARTSEMSGVLPSPNNPTGLGTGSALFYISNPEWWNTPGDVAITDTWTAATPADVTATNGCDPCRALGAEWHLPTQDEWIAVVAAEPITSQATGMSSNLKIAAAGQRNSSGNLASVGQRAYLWSSTPSQTGTDYAKHYYLTSLTNNTNAGGFREQGFSVRCVKLGATAGNKDFRAKKAGIYPNPASNIANIQSESGVQQYAIYSITGSVVQQGKGDSLRLENIPTGLYIVKITFEDGKTQSVKMVKE